MGQNSIYEVVFIRIIVHSHITIIATHRTTLLTTMEHAGHANFIKCGQIRVLFSDNVSFRDYRASVINE